MHQLSVDAVEVQVLEDPIGVAGVGGPVVVAEARDRPTLEARRVEAAEIADAALGEGLDLEVLLPDGSIPQMLREAGDEQVRGLEDVPIGRDHELLLRHRATSRRPETCFASCANPILS